MTMKQSLQLLEQEIAALKKAQAKTDRALQQLSEKQKVSRIRDDKQRLEALFRALYKEFDDVCIINGGCTEIIVQFNTVDENIKLRTLPIDTRGNRIGLILMELTWNNPHTVVPEHRLRDLIIGIIANLQEVATMRTAEEVLEFINRYK